MATRSRLLTLDSNVFIAALKGDEPYSQRCREILGKVPEAFILAEPSIIYQEVCGTLARRAGLDIAAKAETHLDMAIHPRLLASCDRAFCGSSYPCAPTTASTPLMRCFSKLPWTAARSWHPLTGRIS